MIKNLFGLGHSQKDKMPDRDPIGYKGHGTKVFYQALEIVVLTRREGGELLLAHLPDARAAIVQKRIPRPQLLKGDEAQRSGINIKYRSAAVMARTTRAGGLHSQQRQADRCVSPGASCEIICAGLRFSDIQKSPLSRFPATNETFL